ncbi:MAG: hypothetical protein WAT66_03320 [Actinomycetota bacterium]
MAAVAVAGASLTACSSSSHPAFEGPTPLAGTVISGRVIVEDRTFTTAAAGRPRFVPCQGLSGCARTSLSTGEAYPGAKIPPGIDDDIDYTQEFVLYLVGAAFEEATFEDHTAYIRLRPRDGGFQIVKLDARELFTSVEPRFSFQDDAGKVLCTSSWEGCG